MYVSVKSADVAAARAREAGGVIMVEPFDVSLSGRMAVCAIPPERRLAFGRRDSDGAPSS
jgi:predicted enzyme related to lactoylglutathione lyase